MADRVDLDEVMGMLGRGDRVQPEVVASMRNELCAWRATHRAGAVIVTDMRLRLPRQVVIAVETYRSSVENVMARLGFPQTDAPR